MKRKPRPTLTLRGWGARETGKVKNPTRESDVWGTLTAQYRVFPTSTEARDLNVARPRKEKNMASTARRNRSGAASPPGMTRLRLTPTGPKFPGCLDPQIASRAPGLQSSRVAPADASNDAAGTPAWPLDSRRFLIATRKIRNRRNANKTNDGAKF